MTYWHGRQPGIFLRREPITRHRRGYFFSVGIAVFAEAPALADAGAFVAVDFCGSDAGVKSLKR